MPQGMLVSSDGRLSGTPQTAGKFSFTLEVTDSSNPSQMVSESVTLFINDSPLKINTAVQPPAGTQSTPYPGFAFTALGGSPQFTWSVTAGALPAGLTLNSNGTLSGTPSGSGSSTFTVSVTDSAPSPETDSHSFTIEIGPTLLITSASPPSGTDSATYDFQLTVSRGTPPYSWNWSATTQSGLPPGLVLSPAGLIQGVPTTAGTYAIVVTVTDSSRPTLQGTASYTITINPPPAPQILAVNPLAAAVNVPFSFAFSATGGQTPLTWSETGALPAGLSLSAAGLLSGTPLATGSLPVTINVRDSSGQNGTPQALTVIVTPHGFAMTGSMTRPRSLHTATLLNDGTVLIVGGNPTGAASGAALASSELYSPALGTFSPSGALATARYFHTATLLGTGRVLVAGGVDVNGNALASAELYDPSSKTFAALSGMVNARNYYTATLLGNGTVLLAGGGLKNAHTKELATAELFDPATGTFTATGSMTSPREGHSATLLGSGKVLIAGGLNASNAPGATAELYDPSTGTFTATGSMKSARYSHTATLLSNGTVLVTGGNNGTSAIASAEIYDPNSGSFTATGSMNTSREFHTAALLNDGTVLVVGGLDRNEVSLVTAELYAPGSGLFAITGGLQTRRSEHTATVLGTNQVLVTGGSNASGILSTAEIYQ